MSERRLQMRGQVEQRRRDVALAEVADRRVIRWAENFILYEYVEKEQWSSWAPTGVCGLRYYRGEFYRYATGRYERMGEDELQMEVSRFLAEPPDLLQRSSFADVTPRLIKDMVFMIGRSGAVFVPGEKEMPFWLENKNDSHAPDPGRMLSMDNGLFGFDDYLREGVNDTKKILHDWSGRWFSKVQLPFRYCLEAKCPKWEAFLNEIMANDRERVELIRKWFGYCLLPDTSQHLFLLAVGQGANGKSVLFRVLTELLGPENVSHVPLELFGDKFALGETVGKLANIVSEIGEIDRVAEGRLKEFVAADRMTIQRKYKDAIHIKPTARLCLATNMLPRFRDHSEGIWRRMALLPFDVTIPPEKQNHQLAQELIGELSGIFNWSLAGMYVNEITSISLPKVSRAALEEYRKDCDPTRQFLTEHYRDNRRGTVDCSQLYEHYSHWMQQYGYHPLGNRNFGKVLKSLFEQVRKYRPWNKGERGYMFSGIERIEG